jgi:hypothetical protein
VVAPFGFGSGNHGCREQPRSARSRYNVSPNTKNRSRTPDLRWPEERYESLKLGIAQDVKTGLQAFQRAGEKLLKIRQDRLYREEFDTFEAFSRDILGHSKTYSNNLIAAFEVVQALVAQGESVLPDNERVARSVGQVSQKRSQINLEPRPPDRRRNET